MRAIAAAVATLVVSASCTAAVQARSLTIYAAASLDDAMDDLVAAYRALEPELVITVATDSSSAPRIQIEQGAPADLFLSADTSNVETLAAGGLVDEDPQPFASNELALIVPADNPAKVTDVAHLGRPGVRVIAAGDSVPITSYVAQLLDNAAVDGDAYASNVLTREDNVRAVATKVALGEGDVGVVYATDAAATDNVETIAIDDDLNVRAVYTGAVIADREGTRDARTFLDWLLARDGQVVLARHGFGRP
jgi:molybdate transport system substrate-binding protein